jgi:colanic acid biosynthesis glycosyl transferase WcaI
VRLQLWSYNYDPEPTGIGPVSTVWAQEMRRRGHEVTVVAAHPHYPSPVWGRRRSPYREVRDGIPVLRLPLWIGRASGKERVRQEASYAAALSAAAPLLPPMDALVAVSPCFPALAPTIVTAGLRRIPWILWLQDILPDGAMTTGQLEDGPIIEASRQLERTAYRSAAGIVVISEQHRANLLDKGVPAEKIRRVFNPATQALRMRVRRDTDAPPTVMTMGNIGHSQGLDEVVRAFESSHALAEARARLLITGDGVAADEVRNAAVTDRVDMPGVVSVDQLNAELDRATLGLVSQRSDVSEFNLPSKLMNFMGRGVPVVASVRSDSEVATIVREAQAGWVVSAGEHDEFHSATATALADPAERERRGRNAHDFARKNFSLDAMAEGFEGLLERAVV